MNELKWRSQYRKDFGWFVTYGPRRPTREREWFGPMTQQVATKLALRLNMSKCKL